MIDRLRNPPAWRFFEVLPQASAPLTWAWSACLALREVLPAVLAVAIGAVVRAVEQGSPLTGPVVDVGIAFVALQVLAPLADRIVVLDGAQVVEAGAHDELMAANGRYADLYGIQAAAYR